MYMGKSKLFYLWCGEAYLWRTKIIRNFENKKFNGSQIDKEKYNIRYKFIFYLI